MDILILTGMSGSGKSKAADFLEDLGYFCIDNMPPQLLCNIIHSFMEGQGGEGYGVDQLAFVIDVRSNAFLKSVKKELECLDQQAIPYRVLYLDASDETIIRRYKQSRRQHPLGRNTSIAEGLQMERQKTAFLKEMASAVIDTTETTLFELRQMIRQQVKKDPERDDRITIMIESFGFKYGMPLECDEVMDVRFLINPFYDPKLRSLCGLDKEVRDEVLGRSEAIAYLEQKETLFNFTLPYYNREGRSRLTIGVGCTGGRHRSVVIAEALAERFRQNDVRVLVRHRDINKDPQAEAKEKWHAFE